MNTTLLASAIGEWFGGFFIPSMILLIAIAFIIVIRVMASRYKKIAPNQVGIFYGRRYKFRDVDGRSQSRGFRVVTGGGSLLWPIVEQLQLMSTAAFQTVIDETDIPNKDNVKISVKGVATCKISTSPEDLHNAAMAFLGKGDKDIEMFVRNILIGHLRSIIGKLNIDEILRQRDTFNKRVIEESTEELKRLGIQIITLVIQDVNDGHGYIDALGQKTVAEAKRDAAIKVAEADAETKKRTSDAQKGASIVMASNAVEVAKAEKDRDVQKAQFKVLADTEIAKANQALAIATTEQEKVLKVAQAQRDAAEKQAQIEVQKKEAARRQEELDATVVKGAEASRKRVVIDAEAAKSVAVLQAEAEAESNRKKAEGAKQAAVLQGEGEASRTRATLFARAEGEAAQVQQKMIAEAEGQAALKGKVLLAEAEGTKKLAEALAQMTDAAKLIMILDRMPLLSDKLGDALAKVMAAIFSSVAAPLGNIDELRIIDVGGSGRGLNQLGSIVPETVFNVFAGLKARGVDIEELLKKCGVNVSDVVQMLGARAGGSEGKADEKMPAEKPKAAEQATVKKVVRREAEE